MRGRVVAVAAALALTALGGTGSAMASTGGVQPTLILASGQILTWSVSPSPNRGTGDNVLNGVSCVSATACTAAGYSINSSGVYRTLIESWDGTSWSVVPSPNPTVRRRYLYGVSCVSATACTAAGYSTNASGVSGTLIESWDGTSWAIVPSPNPGTGFNGLFGVSCVSATACTAAGSSSSSGTLIESWDGTSWSIVPSPSPGSGTASNVFFGVSCISPTACTAAGSYYSPTLGTSKTLVEFGTATG
jgi:hypothetical protein